MTGVRISELPQLLEVDDDDILVIVDASEPDVDSRTKRVAVADLVPDLQPINLAIDRRGVLLKPTTVLDDSTLLGYDGDPNLVVDGATPGQTYVYEAAAGTHYQRSNGDLFFKYALPNVWVNVGTSGTYRIVDTIAQRDDILDILRYEGLLVLVKSEDKFYYLKDGIGNEHWVEKSRDKATKRYHSFVNESTIKIQDVTDYKVVEVWFEDAVYVPALFGQDIFNSTLFNQQYRYAVRRTISNDMLYIPDTQELFIELAAASTGTVVLL